MIGTHDSYTYLTPRSLTHTILSFMWRTQDKNIEEQKKLGVTYFDIRVRRDGNKWRVCHGLVDFDLTFSTLNEILDLYLGYKVRLILERGSKHHEQIFSDIIKIHENHPTLSFSCIKKGWKVLVDKDPQIVDYTYVPWHSGLSFFENLKKFNFFSTIKRWSKKHNPNINDAIIEDSTKIYFIDYL